jgi:phosphate transport system substrate-binding protein
LLATDPGVSLKDINDPEPFDVPIQIVGRGETSATTQAWTRHLSASCGVTNYADSTSALPIPLRGPLYNKAVANKSPIGETVGKYTLAVGNDGVAKYIDFTAKPTALAPRLVQGRIGYVNAEFALPTSAIVKTNIFNLVTANLQNKALSFVVPSPTSALASYFGTVPPVGGDRVKAELWVQPYSRTSAIADPASSGAYPIVGTSNFLIHTCYRDSNVRRALVGYLQFYYTSPTVNSSTAFNEGILARAGQTPMPLAWRQAISETFWATTASTLPLSLYISKGTSTTDLDVTNPGAPAYTDADGVTIAASKSCVTTPTGGAG